MGTDWGTQTSYDDRDDTDQSTRDETERDPDDQPREDDPFLHPGWYNEQVAAMAGVSRSAPSQDRLREGSPVAQDLGTLPVAGELDDGASERFEGAAGFLEGESVGVEGAGVGGIDFDFGVDAGDLFGGDGGDSSEGGGEWF